MDIISRAFCNLQLIIKEYELVVNGEQKSLLKFQIHPYSVHEERWISRVSETEAPVVFHIIRKPFEGKHSTQIEMKMLPTVSHTILYDMISVVPVLKLDKLSDRIISKSRQEIAKRARKIRNKSVVIAVKIRVVVLKTKQGDESAIKEYGSRFYGGAIPATRSSIADLERTEVVDNSCRKCVICFKEILAGSFMIRLKCSHEFHAKCICDWLSRINLCPKCRFEMPTCIFEHFLH